MHRHPRNNSPRWYDLNTNFYTLIRELATPVIKTVSHNFPLSGTEVSAGYTFLFVTQTYRRWQWYNTHFENIQNIARAFEESAIENVGLRNDGLYLELQMRYNFSDVSRDTLTEDIIEETKNINLVTEWLIKNQLELQTAINNTRHSDNLQDLQEKQIVLERLLRVHVHKQLILEKFKLELETNPLAIVYDPPGDMMLMERDGRLGRFALDPVEGQLPIGQNTLIQNIGVFPLPPPIPSNIVSIAPWRALVSILIMKVALKFTK